MKFLVVVDMQNDFVGGNLGTPEARAIVPYIEGKIEEFKEKGKKEPTKIIFTRDTHFLNEFSKERENIPTHCIKDTPGWCIIDELNTYSQYEKVINKKSFMSIDLLHKELTAYSLHDITFVGVCTDICVISNALYLRAYFPQAIITVDAAGCAGTTPENHKKALDVMRNCCINIINEGE